MQEQERKFLGSILYVMMLGVVFVGGVLYQYQYQPIAVIPKVVEVTKLVPTPQVIETTKVIEVQGECPSPINVEEKQGWFK